MRWIGLLVLMTGCTAGPPPGGAPGATASQAVVLAVPASLRPEFDSIVSQFKTRHPDVQVNVVTATPQQVADESLPADVVAAEGVDAIAPLAPRILPTERRDYAANPLCLVTRAGAAEVKLRTLSVTPWAKRIGIADGRSDPSGAAAEAAMGRLGIRRALADHLVYQASQQLALEKLAKGELDVAFALSTDVAQWNAKEGAAKVQIADRFTDDPRARLPLAILMGSQHAGQARMLVDEIVHGDGQKLFAQKGLLPPSMPIQ